MELIRLGFTKPDGIGHTTLGWIHPDLHMEYLERRIRQETGNDHGIADLND